jgi:death on curing protein
VTEIEFLTVADVESLHDEQLRLFGGLEGIRDRGALESAVAVPASTFDGALLHADVFAMAAAYAFHLAENQPFVDGNKRTALNAALVFLGLNGWDVEDPDERLYDAMIDIAKGDVSKAGLGTLLAQLASRVEGD